MYVLSSNEIESYATELGYFFEEKNLKFNNKMLQKEFWNIFLLLSVIIISDGRSAPVYQHKFNLRNENGFAKLLCGKLVHISINIIWCFEVWTFKWTHR